MQMMQVFCVLTDQGRAKLIPSEKCYVLKCCINSLRSLIRSVYVCMRVNSCTAQSGPCKHRHHLCNISGLFRRLSRTELIGLPFLPMSLLGQSSQGSSWGLYTPNRPGSGRYAGNVLMLFNRRSNQRSPQLCQEKPPLETLHLTPGWIDGCPQRVCTGSIKGVVEQCHRPVVIHLYQKDAIKGTINKRLGTINKWCCTPNAHLRAWIVTKCQVLHPPVPNVPDGSQFVISPADRSRISAIKSFLKGYETVVRTQLPEIQACQTLHPTDFLQPH